MFKILDESELFKITFFEVDGAFLFSTTCDLNSSGSSIDTKVFLFFSCAFKLVFSLTDIAVY